VLPTETASPTLISASNDNKGSRCWGFIVPRYHRAPARRPQAAGDMEQLSQCPSSQPSTTSTRTGFSRQCGHCADARGPGSVLGRPASAGAVGQFPQGGPFNRGRAGGGGAVSRTQGGKSAWNARTWRYWATPAAGCAIDCLGNTSATAASGRSSAGFCSSSSPTNRSCDSIATATPEFDRWRWAADYWTPVARSSISSGGSTCGRCTISAN